MPSQLGRCEHLRELTLEHAMLESALPEDLGCLTALETLLLSNNALTGSIPDLYDHMVSLRTLELHSNMDLFVPEDRVFQLRRKLPFLQVLQLERPEEDDEL